ncbi:hypothetical protein FPZ42_04465 [Mucilaginibacter achroorhodeus]|uniref:Uncharacterized protein n=1 Tax=Mucilaginibacter achroorhodeus TaxID=2599294 RepID=A0A563UB46_9SPHI|nr:hypothetical protein [Mucilaginibacter achroorhodeus]TWR28479.1 hypothetical protein FPZ42_04465 [Mucilaginibacter achroorhodeus]
MKLSNLISFNPTFKSSALIVTAALSLTWAACQKGSNSGVAPTKFDQKQFDEIGIVHNRSVDSTYRVLLAMKTNHQLNFSKDELVSFVRNGMLNNLKIQGTNPKVIIALNSALSGQSVIIKDNYARKINSISDVQITTYYTDSLAAKLTVNQKQVLDKLLYVMTDNSATFEETKSQINSLETNAKSELSDTELPAILASISVAKYTIVYWHDNYDKWVSLLSSSNKVSTQSIKTNAAEAGPGFSWRNVGAADVGGAATGAVATWWLNIAAGPGQVAYGAAIGSGAASASVGNAVYQLLSN